MKKIIIVTLAMVLCVGTAEVSALILNDGGVHTVDWTIDEPVWVEDSPTDDPTTLNLVDGGEISDWLSVFDYSQINISGGSIGWVVETYEYSQATISGGSIVNSLYAFSESNVEISGGLIGDELNVRDNSLVEIYGSNFAVDSIPVGYGQITVGTINELGMLTGTLTGILDSGELINNAFNIDPDATIFLVPEPATLLLVGLGALCLRRRKRM